VLNEKSISLTIPDHKWRMLKREGYLLSEKEIPLIVGGFGEPIESVRKLTGHY